MTTDSDVLNPDRIAQALRAAALWLTPKVVKGYAAEDFAAWPQHQQARLQEAVEGFRTAAGGVPPDAAPSPEQFAHASAAFHTLLAVVREVVLGEWTDAVAAFVSEVEAWVREDGWRSRRVTRKMNETLLGEYSLPQLQVFAEADLYVFNPVARFVPGALGAYDLAIQPSHYITSLYRHTERQWYAKIDVDQGTAGPGGQPWGHETFRASLEELRSLV